MMRRANSGHIPYMLRREINEDTNIRSALFDQGKLLWRNCWLKCDPALRERERGREKFRGNPANNRSEKLLEMMNILSRRSHINSPSDWQKQPVCSSSTLKGLVYYWSGWKPSQSTVNPRNAQNIGAARYVSCESISRPLHYQSRDPSRVQQLRRHYGGQHNLSQRCSSYSSVQVF